MAEADDIPKTFKELIQKVQGGNHEADAQSLLSLARLAEAAERYEDMCLAMKSLIELESKHLKDQGEGMQNFVLNVEARNMLSVAYKNEVGKRRSAFRNLTTEDENGNMIIIDDKPGEFKYKTEYGKSPRTELNDKCEEILDLLSNYLIDETAKTYWMEKAAAAKLEFPDPPEKDDKNAAKEADPKENKDATPQKTAFTVQEERQKHVLLAWMNDTMDEEKSSSKNYPIICANQRTGGLEKAQKFCKEHYKTIEKCKNVRQLQAPSGKPEDNKKFSQELWKRNEPFDQVTTSVETLVFYLKMCGDYKRYLAEMMDDSEGTLKNAAIRYYEDAYATAELILQATHPTRLGLSLNMSVCYYEIAKQKKEACELARSAFDLAIQQLDGLSDDNYKDSTLIMQLLRDNLTIWQQKPDERAEDQED